MVSAAASAGGGKHALTAYAVCTPDPIKISSRKGPEDSDRRRQGVVASTAKCPAGTGSQAGGLNNDVDEGSLFSAVAAPVASLRKGKRTWTSRGFAELTKPDQYIRARVICSGSL